MIRVPFAKKRAVCALLLAGWLGLFTCAAFAAPESLPLDGQWSFRLDPGKEGVHRQWFNSPLPDRIKLPGSTDEAGYGTKNTHKPDLNTLARVVEYTGPAWYQREVRIPAAWKGKRITLRLERCHWETRIWVDDREMGMQDSLSVAHVHDLSAALTPGVHRLTLRVDNTLKYEMGGWAHSTSEQTQTNWNGVVGRIELCATDPVWIDDVQVYPDVERKTVRVRVRIGNATGGPTGGSVAMWDISRKGRSGSPLEAVFATEGTSITIERTLSVGEDVRLWDEFSPALVDLNVKLSAAGDAGIYAGMKKIVFGLHKFAVTTDKRLALNGRKVFLRGTLECCIFPRTGYPAMDVAAWKRIFSICHSYGLNHMRFHSWCPPEAAFAAADQAGFLLQVEAPQWYYKFGSDPKRDGWTQDEVQRILDAYGNHPSFVMMSMGNEPSGNLSVIHEQVKWCKKYDPRRLYMSATGFGFGPDDDYNVPYLRGLQGPGTDRDYREEVAKYRVPVVSHEVGQWTIYPKLAEIAKYTGVLRARNFERVRDDLIRKRMLDLAPAFTEASGMQMILLYKEEIEILRRTPGYSGFQLLDLHDFPGQGTALVGALDPFWDSKGLITPKAYRRFCGPVTPLLRIPKRNYTTDETFAAEVEVSQFGPAELRGVMPLWRIRDEKGRQVASGQLESRTLPTGELLPLGKFSVSLAKVAAPAKLTVTVDLAGTGIGNDWDMWVYPASKQAPEAKDVLIATAWDEGARAALAAGRKVLLLTTNFKQSRKGIFTPVFWSPVCFPGGPGTMSILCDPRHPALAGFPTESYTNWQWYDVLQHSRSVVLDDLPASFRPIVGVIDNFSRNYKLGNIFEGRVGPGRLLVCSIDLRYNLEARPVARQLQASLLDYMNSEAFQPRQDLDMTLLIRPPGPKPVARALGARVVKVDGETRYNKGANAIDGDPDTIWHTPWENKPQPPYPHEIQIDLQRSIEMKGFRYLPRQQQSEGWIQSYEFYVSEDGKNWGQPAAKGTFSIDEDMEQVIAFDRPHHGRFVRLVALSGFNGQAFAAVAELDVIQ